MLMMVRAAILTATAETTYITRTDSRSYSLYICFITVICLCASGVGGVRTVIKLTAIDDCV